MSTPTPGSAAFLSYAHNDDEQVIGNLRTALEVATRRWLGHESFTIFWDRDHIQWGRQWKRRVQDGLADATCFLPIVTPSFFQSHDCCDEFTDFVRMCNGRTDERVMPIYFLDAHEMNASGPRGGDSIGSALRCFQYEDWRDLRFAPFRSTRARRAIDRLARRLSVVLDPVDTPPTPRRRSRPFSSGSADREDALTHPSLRVVFVVDTSKDMAGQNIGMLNFALREWIPMLRAASEDNPYVPVTVEILTVGSRVTWVRPGRQPLGDFDWPTLRASSASGLRLGEALDALKASLRDMPAVAPPPFIVLALGCSPGEEVSADIDAVLREPWVRPGTRLGIAVGAQADRNLLQRFIAHPEIGPMDPSDVANMARYLKFGAITVDDVEHDLW